MFAVFVDINLLILWFFITTTNRVGSSGHLSKYLLRAKAGPESIHRKVAKRRKLKGR